VLGGQGDGRRPRWRRHSPVEDEPLLSRATVIDVSAPLAPEDAEAWLRGAGETELEQGLAALNQALGAYRLAAGDSRLQRLERRQAVVARVGYGAGEEVADGRWSAARELHWAPPARPRRRMLAPDGRLAALLSGRDRPLVCEELVLRARLDLYEGRERHAALQVLIALDAAIAELASDSSPPVSERVGALRADREPVAEAAQAALAGAPDAAGLAAVSAALGRLEAALRARAAARG